MSVDIASFVYLSDFSRESDECYGLVLADGAEQDHTPLLKCEYMECTVCTTKYTTFTSKFTI